MPSPDLRRRPRLAAALLCAALAGCAVGPDYVRPTLPVPDAYKEAGPWKPAEPRSIDAQHRWWRLYDDAMLDGLVEQANAANQNIRQAEANYRQATAIAAQARAALFPTLSASVGANRSRTDTTGVRQFDQATAGLGLSWQPDLWGGIRRSIEAGNDSAQASADDLAGARLSIQSTLVQDYLQLRVTDLLRDQYAATVSAYEKALQLTQSQNRAGVALRSDVALAEAQLKNAQAARTDLEATRAALEHAIAVLTGQAPATFSVAPVALGMADLQSHLPIVPPGLPSTLLERRPDIAGAERRAAAANANIGVARSAYYPALTLSASGGYASLSLAPFFAAPATVWSLGASLAQTLFDGGLRRARDAQAVAAYDGSVALYKQTVLTGFQQVEDDLATLRVLDRESALLDDAVKASQLAERSVLAQYRAGTVNYLSVVTAQTLSLTNQRSATQVLGRRLVASVNLITATGGGWTASDAPPVALASPAVTVSP